MLFSLSSSHRSVRTHSTYCSRNSTSNLQPAWTALILTQTHGKVKREQWYRVVGNEYKLLPGEIPTMPFISTTFLRETRADRKNISIILYQHLQEASTSGSIRQERTIETQTLHYKTTLQLWLVLLTVQTPLLDRFLALWG